MNEPKRIINMRVHNYVDGSKQLIFEVAATKECVGEIYIAFDDVGYLPVFAHLFADWVSLMQPLVKRNGKQSSFIEV
jgi:hypothetical protein